MDKINIIEEITALKNRVERESKENAILLKLGSLLESNLKDSEEQISDGIKKMIAQMHTQTAFVQENQMLILEKTAKIENTKEELTGLSQTIINVFSECQKSQLTLEQKNREIENKILGIHDILNGIRDFLQKETENTLRLREGYDYQILKNFVRQIFHEIHNLEKMMLVEDDSKQREKIKNLIDDLKEILDRNSIYSISPEPGVSYAGQEDIAECLQEKIMTEDINLNGKIAEIVHEGYEYHFNDGQKRVLEPAKVKLFIYSKNVLKSPTKHKTTLQPIKELRPSCQTEEELANKLGIKSNTIMAKEDSNLLKIPKYVLILLILLFLFLLISILGNIYLALYISQNMIDEEGGKSLKTELVEKEKAQLEDTKDKISRDNESQKNVLKQKQEKQESIVKQNKDIKSDSSISNRTASEENRQVPQKKEDPQKNMTSGKDENKTQKQN